MKRELSLSHSDLLSGLRVRYCGFHDCPGGYAYGPVARDEYILHFVREGAGRYQIDRASFEVGRGSSFMMFPGHLLRYQADKTDPWHYYWAAFDGPTAGDFLMRIGMTPASPVVSHRHPQRMLHLFERMVASARQRTLKGDLAFLGAFWEQLAEVAEDVALASRGTTANGRAHVSQHVVKAVLLIQDGYHRADFTIEEAASQLCLARGYFGRVFKSHTGVSPHQFLERTRIESACRLLEDFSLTVKEVGGTVGFKDLNYFDKVFRKKTRLSPSEYRHALQRHAGRAAPPAAGELPGSPSS